MTAHDYLVLVAVIAVALLAASVAAAVLEAIGPDRVARWLHLPEGGYE